MSVEQVPESVLGPRDVLLDVRACGICGSDLHTYAGQGSVPTGQVMGHEFAGLVREVGAEVDQIAVGDRVTGLPIQPCRECPRCRRGLTHLCARWTTRSIAFGLPGAFAERLRIPDAVLGENVHRLPEGVGFTDGALVEPTAVAVHAVRQAGSVAGQVAVVIGLGAIGLQVGQVLLALGAERVFGVDLSERRRQVATGLGLIALDGRAPTELTELVRGQLGSGEADLMVEASGVSALAGASAALVRPRGTLVLVALYHRPAEFDAMALVQREITVRGSANVTPADFRDALGLLGTGRIRMAPLISHQLPLEQIDQAFQIQLDPRSSVKVMITKED
jgi:2-desacetyl-2-hydroxyethyl bacteriochlorophyllide A dehydrogenase